MKKPSGRFNGNRLKGCLSAGLRKWKFFCLAGAVITALFVLSGCTFKDVIDPVNRYFAREAQEEETAPLAKEEPVVSAQVNDSEGKALMKENGQPVTIMVAYETATGGEPRINSDGILETHAIGEVVTYAPGSEVKMADGTPETYAGGEVIKDILGLPMTDRNGNAATRAAGEIVTHGEDEIVYDENGERMTHYGEPYTYAFGEFKYNSDGERETFPVTTRKNQAGEDVTEEDGSLELHPIELMTDASGNPLFEENGEVATKQMEPWLPDRIYENPFEEGEYYIYNVISPYVYFSTPEVEAERIAVVTEEGVDPSVYAKENGEGTVENLQLEILGKDLKPLKVCFDAEGYAYFKDTESDKVLTLAGELRNGVNVLLKDMVKQEYPSYKYWDNPEYTVAENQKWIIKKQKDDVFTICSAVDENYVMTVDDQYGIQYANIMVWDSNDENISWDVQEFCFRTDTPKIEKHLKEGTYYIHSGQTDWMLISLGDGNYWDGTVAYVNVSDLGDGQVFQISYDEYGFATITHGDSDMVLSVGNEEAVNGQPVYQFAGDGGAWQKWIIDPVPEERAKDVYYIRSALNVSEVLDLPYGYSNRENTIETFWNDDISSQFWGFTDYAIPGPWEYGSMDEYAQNFSSLTDYLIMVSSDSNHVAIYQGSKGNWNNIQYWNCVTGKLNTPTIKGEFELNVKTESFDGNMDSPAWYTCYYASGFYPEYFFHSIIYFQGTWNIMDSSMGYNGSHGCVRLETDNARWIFENIPLNTKVVSY